MNFDPKLWRDRSWKKFCAASKRNVCKVREAKWCEDQKAIKGLEKTISWCTKYGLKVQFTRRSDGLYDAENKIIKIACNARPIHQLVYLLHECGHHLVGVCNLDDDRFLAGKFLDWSGTAPEDKKLTLANRIAILEEEFEAWQRGWKLVKKLRIDLDRKKFDEIRLSCLSSYVLWLGAPKK